MNAVLSIELEILEPALVHSSERLLDLHPSQIRWISVRLTAESEAEAVTLSCPADDARTAVRSLVALAQNRSPQAPPSWSGTRVARSASFSKPLS